ncbi:MAG: beta-N-acetylhexosaminidase [Deltaproteobacteria bacterium]|nr:beta-N-acetylhexosaminidase [Deltaproteobacteria bacterium]
MTLRQHILAGIAGKELSQVEKDLILKHKVLGFTLFSRNFSNLEELADLNEQIQALAKQAGYDIVLAVDQEGGRVARLRAPFEPIAPMRDWTALCAEQGDWEKFFQFGTLLAQQVKALGFNLDFAPVADLDLAEENPIIGDRSFSKHGEVVFRMCRQLLRGFEQEQILGCLKHFPGHGNTLKDSHLELPEDERELSELLANDLLPYQKLISENLAHSIMTAHVMYPQIDSKHCGTLSKTIIHDVLRQQFSYTGLVFSDDLLMKAIFDHHNLSDAASRFFECGGDVVLICDQPELSLELLAFLEQEEKNNAALAGFLKSAQKRIQDSFLSKIKTHKPLNNLNAFAEEFNERLFSLSKSQC